MAGQRLVLAGVLAVVGILALAALGLFINLPDAGAFDARVAQIFVENTGLNAPDDIRLLEILAQSGTAFADVLASYRMVIFVLLVATTALLVAALTFLVLMVSQNRRMIEIERQGIRVASLVISRGENIVQLNGMDFRLTPAALETLSVLAEARMDDDILTGAEIEAVISGRSSSECEESAGATRIKRLRDALGNQMVAELLVKTVARRGYMLAVDRRAIRME